MNLSNLKELTKHPGWEEYLDYIDGLKETAINGMFDLTMDQHPEFIALNARLQQLRQITEFFEKDLFDNGKRNDRENFERLQSIDESYGRRFSGFVKRLLKRRP